MPAPKRPKREPRSPCDQHGPGCRIDKAECKVWVDPDSDPVEYPCDRHGKWCRLTTRLCKRRPCRCGGRPLSLDQSLAQLVAQSRPGETEAELATIRDEHATLLATYERNHFSDGMPRPGHPVVEYESLVEVVREVQDAIQTEPVDLFQIERHQDETDQVASVTSIEEARTEARAERLEQDRDRRQRELEDQVAGVVKRPRPRPRPRINPNQPRTIFT